MVNNSALLKAVASGMAKSIKNEPDVRAATKGDQTKLKALILAMGEVRVDEPEKIRIHFGAAIGYGYDFEAGNETRQRYENAVQGTREVGNIPGISGVERVVGDGVLNNRFGWYVTKV